MAEHLDPWSSAPLRQSLQRIRLGKVAPDQTFESEWREGNAGTHQYSPDTGYRYEIPSRSPSHQSVTHLTRPNNLITINNRPSEARELEVRAGGGGGNSSGTRYRNLYFGGVNSSRSTSHAVAPMLSSSATAPNNINDRFINSNVDFLAQNASVLGASVRSEADGTRGPTRSQSTARQRALRKIRMIRSDRSFIDTNVLTTTPEVSDDGHNTPTQIRDQHTFNYHDPFPKVSVSVRTNEISMAAAHSDLSPHYTSYPLQPQQQQVISHTPHRTFVTESIPLHKTPLRERVSTQLLSTLHCTDDTVLETASSVGYGFESEDELELEEEEGDDQGTNQTLGDLGPTSVEETSTLQPKAIDIPPPAPPIQHRSLGVQANMEHTTIISEVGLVEPSPYPIVTLREAAAQTEYRLPSTSSLGEEEFPISFPAPSTLRHNETRTGNKSSFQTLADFALKLSEQPPHLTHNEFNRSSGALRGSRRVSDVQSFRNEGADERRGSRDTHITSARSSIFQDKATNQAVDSSRRSSKGNVTSEAKESTFASQGGETAEYLDEVLNSAVVPPAPPVPSNISSTAPSSNTSPQHMDRASKDDEVPLLSKKNSTRDTITGTPRRDIENIASLNPTPNSGLHGQKTKDHTLADSGVPKTYQQLQSNNQSTSSQHPSRIDSLASVRSSAPSNILTRQDSRTGKEDNFLPVRQTTGDIAPNVNDSAEPVMVTVSSALVSRRASVASSGAESLRDVIGSGGLPHTGSVSNIPSEKQSVVQPRRLLNQTAVPSAAADARLLETDVALTYHPNELMRANNDSDQPNRRTSMPNEAADGQKKHMDEDDITIVVDDAQWDEELDRMTERLQQEQYTKLQQMHLRAAKAAGHKKGIKSPLRRGPSVRLYEFADITTDSTTPQQTSSSRRRRGSPTNQQATKHSEALSSEIDLTHFVPKPPPAAVAQSPDVSSDETMQRIRIRYMRMQRERQASEVGSASSATPRSRLALEGALSAGDFGSGSYSRSDFGQVDPVGVPPSHRGLSQRDASEEPFQVHTVGGDNSNPSHDNSQRLEEKSQQLEPTSRARTSPPPTGPRYVFVPPAQLSEDHPMPLGSPVPEFDKSGASRPTGALPNGGHPTALAAILSGDLRYSGQRCHVCDAPARGKYCNNCGHLIVIVDDLL